MLKQKDQEKVSKIRENQVQLIDKLQSAESNIQAIQSKIVDQNIKQAGIIKSIDQDVTLIENQVSEMKNKIDNITTRILNLVELNEQINKEVMGRQTAKVIEKCASEVEQYQSKKKKDLDDLKQNLNKI